MHVLQNAQKMYKQEIFRKSPFPILSLVLSFARPLPLLMAASQAGDNRGKGDSDTDMICKKVGSIKNDYTKMMKSKGGCCLTNQA